MKKRFFIILGIIVVLLLLGVSFFQNSVREPEKTAFARGYQVALANGCFHCHGGAGLQGIANPNSKPEEVPAWQGGTAMMYIFGPDDIEHWVLDGGIPAQNPDTAALMQMPAYRDVISAEEFTDLKVYLTAVMGIIEIDDTLAERGYYIAEENGCFGCHGPYGLGGGVNPGAFKAYIPGWEGEDYEDLVRSPEELTEWIKKGNLDRIENNSVADYFTKDQVIKMPAYEAILSEQEIDAIEHYIGWLREQDLTHS